ncbi:MAG: NUDIX hydrolase [Verrucomicrobiota bacterium]
MKQDGWQTISSERNFANKHLEVVTDSVQSPTQAKPHSWTTVRRKAAVIVAPMTRDEKIVLIRQERVPIRSTIWEMPAGQIDDVAFGGSEPSSSGQESAKEVALRELREETGYELAKDGELIAFGHYFSSPGFTDEFGYLFLARAVEPCAGGDAHEETESILDCRAFSVPEICRMIAENEIRDASTLGMCARLAARGFISLAPR